MGKGSGPAASSSAAESKETPLVDKPTEKTPLSGSGTAKPNPPATATALSVLGLITIAVVKTQLTAFLFHYGNFPTAYSLYSCVVTDLMLVVAFIIYPSQFSVPKRSMAGVLSLVVFFTCFDLACTNIALANISSALQQSIAATNAFWAMVLETLLYCRFQHPLTYVTVTGVVIGAVLTGGGENDPSLYGVVAAVIAVLASASKYVFTHKALSAFKGEMGSLALLFWVDLFLIPIYLVYTIANGELEIFIHAGFNGTDHGDFTTAGMLTGTAALGGLRALSQYVVLAFLTATSMSTANVFSQITNIVVSVTITQTMRVTVNAQLVAGIAIVVIFSLLYLFIKSNRFFLAEVDAFLGFGKKPGPTDFV